MADSFRSPDFPPDEILAWQISSSPDHLVHANDCLYAYPYRPPRLASPRPARQARMTHWELLPIMLAQARATLGLIAI
jgi:hypothetical protein